VLAVIPKHRQSFLLFPENTPRLAFFGCAVVSTHMTSPSLHSQQVQHRWFLRLQVSTAEPDAVDCGSAYRFNVTRQKCYEVKVNRSGAESQGIFEKNKQANLFGKKSVFS